MRCRPACWYSPVREAWRILKPGDRMVVLDLARHNYEEARELYADLWLGFTQVEVARFLQQAGFRNIETSVVHCETEAPHFETMLAVADK
jgi:ubiquinone/menaquinone biosynthesis C-methylase UbiE